MLIEDILFLILGGVVLTYGANFLVSGASKLALLFGVPPLVIGLTIVAFGTSAPELAVSIGAALKGQADISVGNVIGSNIFNVLFILGSSALIAPLVVSRQVVWAEVPIMVISALVFYLMALDGQISKGDGLILFFGLVGYLCFQYLLVKKDAGRKKKEKDEFEAEFGGDIQKVKKGAFKYAFFVIIGLIMLGLGSDWFVGAAVNIARALGVSELIIGLTIVAIGTSLPEVAASIAATIKGERDIAVGNIVGSNIFNVLSVIGITAITSSVNIPISPTALAFDFPIMLAACFACLPIFFAGHSVYRIDGAFLLFYYFAYLTYLLLLATNNGAIDTVSYGLKYFVVPITILWLSTSLIRSVKKHVDGAP